MAAGFTLSGNDPGSTSSPSVPATFEGLDSTYTPNSTANRLVLQYSRHAAKCVLGAWSLQLEKPLDVDSHPTLTFYNRELHEDRQT
jgi:hypothetical protein